MELKFGLSRAVPEDVHCAWGARMIAPADVVSDRTDWQGDDAACWKLSDWLVDGGALNKARVWLRASAPLPQDDMVYTAWRDDRGIVVASTNHSGGYVYVAAWLWPAG
jgi:hypothetical protein